MNRHLLICGERGVGKSTLIRRLLEHSTREVGGFVTKRLPVADENGFFRFTSIPHRRVRASGATRRRISSERATAARASAIRRSLTALAHSSSSPRRKAASF